MTETISNRYSVAINFDADEGSSEIAQLITEAFSTLEPPLARPCAVRAESNRVIAEFHELGDELPTGRQGASPPRGHHAVLELKELHSFPSALVPVVRALVALSEARAGAGLSPRQRLVIEVNPESHHGQEGFEPLADE